MLDKTSPYLHPLRKGRFHRSEPINLAEAMKLIDVLILSLAVVFVIISIHQSMVAGFKESYWAVMIALLLFFVYNYRKRK